MGVYVVGIAVGFEVGRRVGLDDVGLLVGIAVGLLDGHTVGDLVADKKLNLLLFNNRRQSKKRLNDDTIIF